MPVGAYGWIQLQLLVLVLMGLIVAVVRLWPLGDANYLNTTRLQVVTSVEANCLKTTSLQVTMSHKKQQSARQSVLLLGGV